MKRSTIIVTLLILLGVLVSDVAMAVSVIVPPGAIIHNGVGNKVINVQGKLTDATGKILSGPVTVTFRLYTNSADALASAVWVETQNMVISNGLFNVGLGSVTPLDSLPFNKTYYLGIQVAGDANEMTPRQLLGASAYALGSLGDFNVSGNAIVGSSVSVSGSLSANSVNVHGQDVQLFLVPVGAIIPFGGAVAPQGYLLCDGSPVSRSSYAGLFSAIGSAWGAGDGSSTFNLPDLRGRTMIGQGQGTGLTTRALGKTLGEESHILNLAEMPSHNHAVNDPGHTHGGQWAEHQNIPNNNPSYGTYGIGLINQDGAQRNGNLFKATLPSSSTGLSLQSSGGGTAHNIMQPSAVVNYIIKA